MLLLALRLTDLVLCRITGLFDRDRLPPTSPPAPPLSRRSPRPPATTGDLLSDRECERRPRERLRERLRERRRSRERDLDHGDTLC